MARPDRKAAPPLSFFADLAREPYAFDFLVALRRLECFFRDQPRHGTAARPTEEPVRFGQDPSFSFATSAITSFTPPKEDALGRLAISFFGLFGPHGPLPLHLTEYARDRARNAGDHTLSAFANLFHHRMIMLLYRAWSTAQPTLAADRPESNRFHTYVGALFGLGQPSLLKRNAFPDHAKLFYAARLGCPTRNAEGLECMIADYFGIPVDIEQFVGEWVALPQTSRFRLGHSPETSTLGMTAVLGARVYRSDHKFRVVLGPLDREQFQNMLPGSATMGRLIGLVRTYLGDELHWDVRLVLSPDASDVLQLGESGRLGWNARLGRITGQGLVQDLVVDPFSKQTQRLKSRATAVRRQQQPVNPSLIP